MSKHVRISIENDREGVVVRQAADQALAAERARVAYTRCPDCGTGVFRPTWTPPENAPRLELLPAVPIIRNRGVYRVAGIDGQVWEVTASRPDEALYLEHVCPQKAAGR